VAISRVLGGAPLEHHLWWEAVSVASCCVLSVCVSLAPTCPELGTWLFRPAQPSSRLQIGLRNDSKSADFVIILRENGDTSH
jgi:hypothetical protein